jgi:hypothetical protein
MIGTAMLADLVHTLDRHTGATTAILTAALVVVTAYYAYLNRRMVRKMKYARDAAILPKLALSFHALGPNVVDLAIRNVGPGAALEIDVEVRWQPVDSSGQATTVRWRRNLMASGEQVEMFPPGNLSGNLDVLPDAYRDVRLIGRMNDAAGKTHPVDEVFADLAEWRDLLGDAHESWKPPEPERRLAEAMQKQFSGTLRDLNHSLGEVARAVRQLQPPADEGS